MMRWPLVALLLMTGGAAWAQTGPQTGPTGGGSGGGTITTGASGPITVRVATVAASSGLLNAAGIFANFGRVCVDPSAAAGVWVNWGGAAATQAPPSDHILPGACIIWLKQSGYLPTQQWNAISDSGLSTVVTVMGN